MSTQPDEDELQELMSNRKRVRRENVEHYLDNEDELREQFGGHVIAIADSNVVNSIETADDAEEILTFIDHIRSEYEGAYITEVPEPNQVMMF